MVLDEGQRLARFQLEQIAAIGNAAANVGYKRDLETVHLIRSADGDLVAEATDGYVAARRVFPDVGWHSDQHDGLLIDAAKFQWAVDTIIGAGFADDWSLMVSDRLLILVNRSDPVQLPVPVLDSDSFPDLASIFESAAAAEVWSFGASLSPTNVRRAMSTSGVAGLPIKIKICAPRSNILLSSTYDTDWYALIAPIDPAEGRHAGV